MFRPRARAVASVVCTEPITSGRGYRCGVISFSNAVVEPAAVPGWLVPSGLAGSRCRGHGDSMDGVTSRSARVTVEIRWHGDRAMVAVHGEIDFFTAPALSARLGEVVEARPRQLILDLGGVPFLDCAGARAVAGAGAGLPGCCQVVIRSLRPSPRRLFEVTDLWHGCVVDGILRTGGEGVIPARARRWPQLAKRWGRQSWPRRRCR